MSQRKAFIPLRKCYAPSKASLLRRLLYFFARFSYAIWLQKHYRVEHHNVDFLRSLQAPYILLANHVSNVDPFIYNILCPYPITWIIGRSIERDFKYPWLLRTLRCISRSKEISNVDTIRKIQQWVDEGEVIGIFPEGQSSFSGVSHAIPESTAKLLRFLKVPVVALRNEGGYFAMPRWARQPRCSAKGQGPGIHLYYELLFDAQQIRTAKLAEIQQKLQQALYYNPYAKENAKKRLLLDLGLQKQHLAEDMELLFYACLSCYSKASLGAMESQGMQLHCTACGTTWQISESSDCLSSAFTQYNLEQYYQKQLKLLQDLAAQDLLEIRQAFARIRRYTAEDEALRLRCGGSSTDYNGYILLNGNGLELTGQNGCCLYRFSLEDLFSSHVFQYNTWEFRTAREYDESCLFAVEFPRKKDSAFLLLDSLKALQQAK